jgi:hypothetical protein
MMVTMRRGVIAAPHRTRDRDEESRDDARDARIRLTVRLRMPHV